MIESTQTEMEALFGRCDHCGPLEVVSFAPTGGPMPAVLKRAFSSMASLEGPGWDACDDSPCGCPAFVLRKFPAPRVPTAAYQVSAHIRFEAPRVCEACRLETDAVFSRYNILSAADIRDGVKNIEAGARAVIHSSFTVKAETPRNGKEDAGKETNR